MVDKKMTAQDIIAIIEVGAKFNLQRLKFGELDVCFGSYQPEPIQMDIPAPGISQPEPGNVYPEESRRLLKERIAQLQIEDPLLAEKMIAEGDLVDDTEEYDGDEEA